MPHEAKDIVRRFHEVAWNEGDFEAARGLLASDLVDHDPLEFPGRAPGAEGLLQVVEMIRSGLPDFQRAIDQQLGEGNCVVTRFTDRGTHAAELMGIPPTNKEIVVHGINIELVQDGHISEVWHVEDLLGLMRQLGVVAM